MTTRTPKPYEPKGAIVPFMEAVAANPKRVWTYPEAARVMGLEARRVSATVLHAVQCGYLYRGGKRGSTVLSGTPFAPEYDKPVQSRRKVPLCEGEWPTTMDDPRVPKVVQGWTPPKMTPPRVAA
jgi:hypothetical protein